MLRRHTLKPSSSWRRTRELPVPSMLWRPCTIHGGETLATFDDLRFQVLDQLEELRGCNG